MTKTSARPSLTHLGHRAALARDAAQAAQPHACRSAWQVGPLQTATFLVSDVKSQNNRLALGDVGGGGCSPAAHLVDPACSWPEQSRPAQEPPAAVHRSAPWSSLLSASAVTQVSDVLWGRNFSCFRFFFLQCLFPSVSFFPIWLLFGDVRSEKMPETMFPSESTFYLARAQAQTL
jgi:hypothetical protein